MTSSHIYEPKSDPELIFVVLDAYEEGKVAIESNFGLVAFGSNKEELINDILYKVGEYFKAGFTGVIRIREFQDTVIKC
ncbi:hypothetical protein [Parapedobacter sp. DT-150]|uniref:hypothetical protein n=1 Tax=Parapedobacter sp. DT-150 TaxID=3396162 RepID=UPI003F193E66